GLDAKDAEIVRHLRELFLGADRSMTWNEYIRIPARNRVADFKPLRDVAVVRVRRDPEKPDVAQKNDFVLRQVGDDVAPRMRRSGEPELHFGVPQEIAHI